MEKQLLHSGWKMTAVGKEDWIPAIVPGSVYNDLLNAGRMEDPYWRDNEMKALALMDEDYLYATTFDADPSVLDSDRVLLRCEGLDTIADITLNGVLLGSVKNMHRCWEFDVKGIAKGTGNELTILFHSPTRYIKEQDKVLHAGGSPECMVGFPNLRKAHCMFGWDWGPRLPDAGIWRDIMLCGINAGRVTSTHVLQHHEDGRVRLELIPEIENLSGAELSYEVVFTTPDGKESVYTDSPSEIVVEDPQLWWPNGLGEHPLYTIEVRLLCGGKVVDSWKKRIGLRTMTMHIEKDEFGETFAHEVNGVQFFAMGADYIPEDNILSRVNPERTRWLLEQSVAANHNVVRVWGGGYYPDDYFYDICDELGLVVWQDFMFACAHYNLTEEFEENLRAEFEENIKRIRSHASLGLWCGNNEMETFTLSNMWEMTPWQKGNYVRLYEYILPKLCKQLAPQTFYWPSSPSSGGDFDNPWDPNRGDVHYWAVWHGSLPFTDYRNYYFRYVSEFGFQAFPTMKTIESFTKPEDRNIFSYIMEKHQRNKAANSKIMTYLGETFRYPNNFATLMYTSQLLSGEAMKYGVEHWRRHRGRCMGAVVWQLNDCWPVASWSSIDYFGRWKALHYYEKRFFAPVLLSCEEESFLFNPDPNRECRGLNEDTPKSIRLNVSNETRQEQKVTVKWKLCNNHSEVLRDGGETEVTVPALSSVWLDKVELPEANIFTDYVRFECWQDGRMISASSVIFSVPKYFEYLDPQLSWRVEGDEVVVTAKEYAHSVEILNENEDWILEDNYFDLDAGEERRIRIISGKPEGIHARSVYDIR
ncbi:MAG TPA: glycoside hydrolase family 2 protein [Candidatus Gallacutalibacter pullistercoris]|nr:glycoside hydrolase family 2 protein [Candidatus Gallacutalibacter pullistercoris]